MTDFGFLQPPFFYNSLLLCKSLNKHQKFISTTPLYYYVVSGPLCGGPPTK